MYMRHRYYDSRMRGFITRGGEDALGNMYSAFGNNPGSVYTVGMLYGGLAVDALDEFSFAVDFN